MWDLAAQGAVAALFTLLGAAGASVFHVVRRERADAARDNARVEATFAPVLRRTRAAQVGRVRPSWWPESSGRHAAHRAGRVTSVEPTGIAPSGVRDDAIRTDPGSAFVQPTYRGAAAIDQPIEDLVAAVNGVLRGNAPAVANSEETGQIPVIVDGDQR